MIVIDGLRQFNFTYNLYNLVFVDWKVYHPMAREPEALTEYRRSNSYKELLEIAYIPPMSLIEELPLHWCLTASWIED